MEFKTTLTNLYYMLICADGKVNERELALGRKMMEAEGLGLENFEGDLEELKAKDISALYNDSLAALKKLDRSMQIKLVAWLCVIANSDGFMDKEEWILIYKIYHTELKLSLEEVMKTQKELNRIIHGKSFQSLGVRMGK
ncbi:MAG: hypothetical protein EBR30_12845 [Cytophagia bacterium]|nr:hypothetical protein [Cytophagia bacterium]